MNIILKAPNASWCEGLNKEIIENSHNYSANKFAQHAICWLHGVVIARLERHESINNSLEKLLNMCHPEYSKNVINANNAMPSTDEDLRKNVAKGLGMAAMHNFEAVIDFVNQVYSAEVIAKKQGGFSGFFGSSGTDKYRENIRITILHTLGYISRYADPS